MGISTPIDYYKELGFAPVALETQDRHKHFGVRRRLYEKLGISPRMITGSNILEFGPGLGHNALYPLSLSPKEYHFVDGSQACLDSCQEMVKTNAVNAHITYSTSLVDSFASDELYDIVFCEAVLPIQCVNPAETALHAASFTSSGGIFVATCIDSVSILPDFIMRLIGQACVDDTLSPLEQGEMLCPMFLPHLEALQNMGKTVVDWILNTVFQPIYGPVFSIGDAIKTLQKDFQLLATVPSFTSDWRWYKNLCYPDHEYNAMVIDAYERNLHNLLDFSVVLPPRNDRGNARLKELSDTFFQLCMEFEKKKTNTLLAQASELVREISQNIESIGPEAKTTAEKYKDAATALRMVSENPIFPDCGRFTSLFGRTQHYVSFVRV